jgi:RNA polymerase primary sigma factor
MRALQITKSITNRETQAIERYFNDMEQEPLITADEEVALSRRIRGGDMAALVWGTLALNILRPVH